MLDFLVDFAPVLIVGVSLGSLWGLVGLAFTIIINATQLVNFGQGDFAVVGVFAAWLAISVLGLPLWMAFLIALGAGALIGLIAERTIVTPLIKRGAGMFSPILGTMAVGMMAAGVVGIYTGFYWMPIEHFMGLEPWKVEEIYMDTQAGLIIIATVILVIGYWFLLNKTRFGMAFRATGFNQEVATLLGIQVSRMIALSFMISGVIAAIAGVLCAPLAAFTAHDGLPLCVGGFVAVIVGGWGNPYATVLGGITLGLIRSLLTGYFSSAHAELTTFIVLVIVLTFKPNGLFPGFMLPKTTKD